MGAVAHPGAASRRGRAVVLAAASGVAALAWFGLARSPAALDAAGAAHVHGDASGAFAAASGLWLLMMTAMMLPAVMPWLAAHAAASRGREGSLGTALFALGYLAAWGGYSLAAAALQVLAQQAWPRAASVATASAAGGVLLMAAGAFQLTPLKQTCLTHCRSPIGYFMSRWRSGRAGAFRMGLDHGGHCVVCCWGLMALMWLTGAMSLAWMAALTLLLCVEKLAPGGVLASRLVGAALLAWGGAVLLLV